MPRQKAAKQSKQQKKAKTIDDSLLPATLTADWLEDETNQGKQFPSYEQA